MGTSQQQGPVSNANTEPVFQCHSQGEVAGEPLQTKLSNPCSYRNTKAQLPTTMSRRFLSTSKDGDSTTSWTTFARAWSHSRVKSTFHSCFPAGWSPAHIHCAFPLYRQPPASFGNYFIKIGGRGKKIDQHFQSITDIS